MREGASRDLNFDFGFCLLSLGRLRTGRRYYINRALTKRKETELRESYSYADTGVWMSMCLHWIRQGPRIRELAWSHL